MNGMRLLTTLAFATLSLAAPAAAEKKVIQPKEFATGRPFSPGILANGTLYVAGQIGSDLKTGAIPEKFEDEVKQTLDNIGLVLKEAGMTFDNVVTVHVYLTDIDLFARMNGVYVTYFKEGTRPARTTIGGIKLAGAKAKVEITVTAAK